MNIVETLAVAAALAAAALPAHAGYSELLVFGDSLSDTGNAQIGAAVFGLPDPAPAAIGFYQGRFSNGPIWADLVHERLVGGPSLPVAPRLFGLPLPSGANYAVGGARAATNADPSTDFAGQLAFFQSVTGGVVAPGTLVAVAFGSNDISANIQNTADKPALGASIASIVGGMQFLNLAGATDFLVLGVGDIGAEPRFLADGALGLALSQAFDAALRDALDAAVFAPGTRIRYFDTLGFFSAVSADPAAFGLPALDAVKPCFTVPGAIPACTGYAFADDIHPTSALQLAYGKALFATVPAPPALALLGLGAAALVGRRRNKA